MVLEAPDLRIVPEDLWRSTHDRLERTRAAYIRTAKGRLWGRPDGTLASPYLLTGSVSAASAEVVSSFGSGPRRAASGCTTGASITTSAGARSVPTGSWFRWSRPFARC